jgi:hypothetical protein
MSAGLAAAITRVELAEQLMAENSPAEAAVLLDAAAQTLEAISARPALARIEALRKAMVATSAT